VYHVRVQQPTSTPVDRVFALLDRAQMGYELKQAVFEAATTSTSTEAAVLSLQALDLEAPLLGAVSEALLSR
jgi:hypothetical protein